jgi:hypothetical protein
MIAIAGFQIFQISQLLNFSIAQRGKPPSPNIGGFRPHWHEGAL